MTTPKKTTSDADGDYTVYRLAVTSEQLEWVLDNCPQAKYIDNHVAGVEIKHIVYTSCNSEVALFNLRWGISFEKFAVARTHRNG